MPGARPLDAWDPRRVGRYSLAEVLGEGGQGIVYLAEADGEAVALKLLHPRYVARGASRDRFLREIEVARRVSDYTARVLEAGEHHGIPYVVSEYISGPSLAARVADGKPVEGGELTRLASGTLTALVAIHAAGIVHCDFKPENIVLGPDGPRVVDFGIARALETITADASRLIGTPAYMAPEQVDPDLGTIGPPTDLFAWAATLCYAATGVSPFQAATVPAVLHRVLHHHPDVSALPVPLRDVVTSTLAKAPELRPTAADALISLLSPPPPRAPVPSEAAAPSGHDPAPELLHGGSLDHGDEVTAVAFGKVGGRPVALSGGAGGELRVWDLDGMRSLGRLESHRLGPSLPCAVGTVAIGEVRGRPVALAAGGSLLRTWDLRTMQILGRASVGHGTRIRSVAFGEVWRSPVALSAGDGEAAQLWDPIDLRRVPLAGPISDAVSVAFGGSADRPLVLFGGGDGTVRLWNPAAMRFVGEPLAGHTGEVRSVAFGRMNGRPAALSAGADGTVRAWDLTDLRPVGEPFTGPSGTAASVAFGEVNGRPVAAAGGRDGTVRVWDLHAPRSGGLSLTGHTGAITSVAFGEADGRPVVLSGGRDGLIRVWNIHSHPP
ncbi:WD40 repeat domain-containing serine/threonine protein kinase [Actinocorallia populi]|uniref:WD40 repeat domain-containing serine/threonine protein kinase n=1 Tax=Actinocorallia populi TaxID=2079200 RepID=UPI000D096B24|nr:serine/threonine-protein kinase [Actinocorallia populi]